MTRIPPESDREPNDQADAFFVPSVAAGERVSSGANIGEARGSADPIAGLRYQTTLDRSECADDDPFDSERMRAEREARRRTQVKAQLEELRRSKAERRRQAADPVHTVRPRDRAGFTPSEQGGSGATLTTDDGTFLIPDWMLAPRDPFARNLYDGGDSDFSRTDLDYRDAGFPADLVNAARDEQAAAVPHRRHGAQYAAGFASAVPIRSDRSSAIQKTAAVLNGAVGDDEPEDYFTLDDTNRDPHPDSDDASFVPRFEEPSDASPFETVPAFAPVKSGSDAYARENACGTDPVGTGSPSTAQNMQEHADTNAAEDVPLVPFSKAVPDALNERSSDSFNDSMNAASAEANMPRRPKRAAMITPPVGQIGNRRRSDRKAADYVRVPESNPQADAAEQDQQKAGVMNDESYNAAEQSVSSARAVNNGTTRTAPTERDVSEHTAAPVQDTPDTSSDTPAGESSASPNISWSAVQRVRGSERHPDVSATSGESSKTNAREYYAAPVHIRPAFANRPAVSLRGTPAVRPADGPSVRKVTAPADEAANHTASDALPLFALPEQASPYAPLENRAQETPVQNNANPYQVTAMSAAQHSRQKMQPAERPSAVQPVEQAQPDANKPDPRKNRRETVLGAVIAALCIACVVLAISVCKTVLNTHANEKQINTILNMREEAVQRSLDRHPFRFRDQIEMNAARNNLNPAFVVAIVLNESSFRTDAESSVGARGLMQLMDPTAGWIHEKLGDTTPYSFDDMYTAEANLQYGCWYLNYLAKMFRGDPILVAAAFHAGQGEISNWLNDSRYSSDHLTIPLNKMPEGPTRTYVTRVLNDFGEYRHLYYDLKLEP